MESRFAIPTLSSRLDLPLAHRACACLRRSNPLVTTVSDMADRVPSGRQHDRHGRRSELAELTNDPVQMIDGLRNDLQDQPAAPGYPVGFYHLPETPSHGSTP